MDMVEHSTQDLLLKAGKDLLEFFLEPEPIYQFS